MKPLSKKSLVSKAVKTQDFMANPVFPNDARWMGAAIAESRRAVGNSGVNPPVGCVLVTAGGHLLASGHTGVAGVPHAEASALATLDDMGRSAIRGGTAYVTLEPCAHHGKTPPCADALIAAGIARLVVAIKDPDTRVNGAGMQRIAAAGIEVCLGVKAKEAHDVMRGFINRIQYNKPLCSLKIAASIDGKIALADGEKRWLTGPRMRRYVHLLRSQADAIITGIGTVLADNPQMNCRNAGLEDLSPPVFVFDRLLRIPSDAALLQSQHPLTLFCGEGAPAHRREELGAAGCVIVVLPNDANGKPDVEAALRYLGETGINNAFVEAGTGLVTSFLAADAVDQIYWTQSDHILGADALPAIGGLTPPAGTLSHCSPALHRTTTDTAAINTVAISVENKYIQSHHQMIGGDRLIILQKQPADRGKAQA